MTIPRFACTLAILCTVAGPRAANAQLEIGTWVRQAPTSTPGAMTLTVEACCAGGRRLTYHVPVNGQEILLVVETKLDGADAPVLVAGRPSGETMAIKRTDANHASSVLKMNGQVFATSTATLSPDGKTLTVVNDVTSAIGGQPVGKATDVWSRKQ
jgi:hypothetical protein